MRFIIWLLLLSVVAGVAATALGGNDGLVSLYWSGWRMDLSLNLFLFGVLALCVLLVIVLQATQSLSTLPARARQWRVARRDRSAQAALRDALSQYFAGRYTRAQRSADRALAISASTPEVDKDQELTVLAHLLYANSAHKLQDKTSRDAQLRQLRAMRAGALSRTAEEGARLLAAEWALEDRDADAALEELRQLPAGVGRRTQALRLKLQAARLARLPQEALTTARLLAKHQGFSKTAALGLLRALAFECLDAARDADQLKRVWQQFDPADRRDPHVAAKAATLLAGFDQAQEARQWLRPFWDQIVSLQPEERAAVAVALVHAREGLGSDWLPRLEDAARAYGREAALAMAFGFALLQCQLWGKAKQYLEQAAGSDTLAVPLRRMSWLALAQLAEHEQNAERVHACLERAARLP